MYKLIDFIDINKLNWGRLSKNANAIHLLEKNQDKIYWPDLSKNPSIFELDYNSLKNSCGLYKEELIKKLYIRIE